MTANNPAQWPEQVRLRVNGPPAPQGSKRHVGRGVVIEMSAAVGPWREAVRSEVQRAGIMFGARRPLSVTILFSLPRPRGHFRTGRNAGVLRDGAPVFPAGRPDLDKLVRSTLDGLAMGGAYADDSQVVSLRARKVYADGVPPGAEIGIHVAGGERR
jgi:crossover junction endodeoxyribonuclease RusA